MKGLSESEHILWRSGYSLFFYLLKKKVIHRIHEYKYMYAPTRPKRKTNQKQINRRDQPLAALPFTGIRFTKHHIINTRNTKHNYFTNFRNFGCDAIRRIVVYA